MLFDSSWRFILSFSSSGAYYKAETKCFVILLLSSIFTIFGILLTKLIALFYFSTTYGKAVAIEYLKFFDFQNETITEALQKFLMAFHLSGETQERERILIPFSKRYQECNNPEYGSEGRTESVTVNDRSC